MSAPGSQPPQTSGSTDILPEREAHRIARLARLAIDDATISLYTHQLSAFLVKARALGALDLERVSPMLYPGDTSDVWDEDEPKSGLPAEALLRMAPQTHPPFISVPKVLGDQSGS